MREEEPQFMSDTPDYLIASARALEEGRPEEAEAILNGAQRNGAWLIAETGLRAFISKDRGLPFRSYQPMLDELSERFNRALGTAKIFIDERTPNSLASARVLCDNLIANAEFLGNDCLVGQALRLIPLT